MRTVHTDGVPFVRVSCGGFVAEHWWAVSEKCRRTSWRAQAAPLWPAIHVKTFNILSFPHSLRGPVPEQTQTCLETIQSTDSIGESLSRLNGLKAGLSNAASPSQWDSIQLDQVVTETRCVVMETDRSH